MEEAKDMASFLVELVDTLVLYLACVCVDVVVLPRSMTRFVDHKVADLVTMTYMY